MERILKIVFLLWLSVMGATQSVMADTRKDVPQDVPQITRPEKPSAVLTDTRDVYRLCNTRPVRILPTGGRLPWSVQKPPQHFPYFKSQYCYVSGRTARRLSAPFLSVAPCDYYVFALRRLIC